MSTQIDTLLVHAIDIIKNTKKAVSFSKHSKTPSHLFYDIRRIEHQWETHGVITEADIKFLEHIHANSIEYLKNNVYILGNWHSWRSSRHTIYNMRSDKRLKRLKRSKLQYKALDHA